QGAVWEDAATGQPKEATSQLAALEEMPIPPDARNYWAFRKPVRHPVPTTGDPLMDRHPVDAFLMKSMKEKGLKPAPPADRATLLRRASLDLIGLPPSPAEVAEFLSDQSPDAWER